MPLLEVEGLRKSFGAHPILKGISLKVMPGEFLTFLGPSGCGKTTTLRIIAGFERPDEGTVRLKGVDVTGLPPYQRDVHTVFQHYALFPHYDVFENVAFSLRLERLPAPEIRSRVEEALSLVKLAGFERRRISQISGGQQQRVAVARSLVGRPSLLLLDEPLGALDLKLRRQMQLELKEIQKRIGIAFVYVTHDQEEALTISDRIAVFRAGEIAQVGSPRDVYESPRSSFVADFIGSANVLEAVVAETGGGEAGLLLEGEVAVRVPLAGGAAPPVQGSRVPVAIRPECIEVRFARPERPEPGTLLIEATLREAVYLGAETELHLRPFKSSKRTLLATTLDPVERQLRNGAGAQRVWLELHASDVLLLEPDGASPAPAGAPPPSPARA